MPWWLALETGAAAVAGVLGSGRKWAAAARTGDRDGMDGMGENPLHAFPGYWLARLYHQWRAVFEANLEPYGVQPPVLGILTSLEQGCRTPSELAAFVNINLPGMTRLIDKMEEAGLCARRPNEADRRSVLIEPTEKGLALLPDLRRIANETVEQLTEGLPPETVGEFIRLARAMAEACEGAPSPSN